MIYIWLKVNGNAIYGDSIWKGMPSKENENPKRFFTVNNNTLNVITTEWLNKPFTITGLKNAGKVCLLGTDMKAKCSFENGELTIYPSVISPNSNPCNHAWVYSIENF